MSSVRTSKAMLSTRFRGLERIDGTPLVIAPFVTTHDELQPWASVLRLELMHRLSRALRGDASVDSPDGRGAEYLLEGAAFRGAAQARCALFCVRRLDVGASIWTDRMTASAPDMPSSSSFDILRLTRGIVMALRIDGARRSPCMKERAALRAWAELWTRPQSEATNGAALNAIAEIPSVHMLRAHATAALAYAHWRGARYRWNGLLREGAAASAIALAADAVERTACDADARFVFAMAQFPGGDDALAEAQLQAAVEADPSHAPAHGSLGFALLRQGRIDAAQAACETALRISPSEPLGCVWHATLSIVHAHRGEVAGARHEAELAVVANPKHRFAWLARSIAAGVAGSHEDARRHVERLAALGPPDGIGPELWSWCSPLVERMRSVAAPRIDRGIQSAPSCLRITTLGSFAIERDGKRISWGRKPPRRALEILKFLVVHDGTPVAPVALMEAIWPGEAGPHVRRRLDTALYRLRRLLGEGAIVSIDGTFTLGASVDVDVRRFVRESDPSAYTGVFLPEDLHITWTMPARESLREHLQSMLIHRAEQLIDARRHDEAITLCESGIAHHPTAEALYRLAIRACRLAGRRDEGARFYERCRLWLGSDLGLRPSRATQDEHWRLIRD